MSLGLFAAAVVLLQQHGALSLARMAHLLAAPEDQVLQVLLAMKNQGHCLLTHSGDSLRASWTPQPTEAE